MSNDEGWKAHTERVIHMDATRETYDLRQQVQNLKSEIQGLTKEVEHLTKMVRRLGDAEMEAELDRELRCLGLHDLRRVIPRNRRVPKPMVSFFMWEIPGAAYANRYAVSRHPPDFRSEYMQSWPKSEPPTDHRGQPLRPGAPCPICRKYTEPRRNCIYCGGTGYIPER